MSLLCQIGFHKPGKPFVNGGCSFSVCRRCGCDLIKAGTGGWRRPRGYRVVWKTRAEAAVDVLLAPPPSGGRGNQRRSGELPIQEVLRQLHAGDIMKEEAGSRSWDADIRVGADSARGRVQLDDFMQIGASDRGFGTARRAGAARAPVVPEAPPLALPRSNGAG